MAVDQSYRPKPQAEFLILVERARHNEDGSYDFYGVHNHTRSDVFPVITLVSFVLSLVGEPSEEVRFTAHMYDGLVEIGRTNEIVVQLNSIGQSIKPYNFDAIRFDHPGPYQLVIRNEGMTLIHTQLTMVEKREVDES